MKRNRYLAMLLILTIFISGGCSSSKTTSIGGNSTQSNKNSTDNYVLNEANLIKTTNGSYTITFEGARYPTSEWSKTHVDHKVIFLDYVYSNIDFKKEDGTILLIPHAAFIVSDQNGVILNASYMYDITRNPANAPAGTTCEASLPYIVNSDVTEINVKLTSGTTGEVVGEITIPVTAPV